MTGEQGRGQDQDAGGTAPTVTSMRPVMRFFCIENCIALQIDVSKVDVAIGQNRNGSLADEDQQLGILQRLNRRQSFEQRVGRTEKPSRKYAS